MQSFRKYGFRYYKADDNYATSVPPVPLIWDCFGYQGSPCDWGWSINHYGLTTSKLIARCSGGFKNSDFGPGWILSSDPVALNYKCYGERHGYKLELNSIYEFAGVDSINCYEHWKVVEEGCWNS